MVYLGSGQFGPYVQQLMILTLKAPKIWGLQQSVKEEDLVEG
jgi:topoisomerase IA-like protein